MIASLIVVAAVSAALLALLWPGAWTAIARLRNSWADWLARLRLAFSWRPLVGLLVLFALPALAQVEPLPPASPPGWLSPVLQYLVAPLVPLLGIAMLAALGKLVAYLHSREKDGKAFAALAQVGDIAATVAAKVEAVERQAMPGVLADGKVTAEEGKQLAALALAQLKASLAPDVLGQLGKVVGAAGVDGYLAAKLEQANAAQSVPQ